MVEIAHVTGYAAILQLMNKLFGDGSLLLLSTLFVKPTDIHLGTLACHKPRNWYRFGTQIYKTSICLIDGITGTNASRLNLNSLAINNFTGGDGTFEDQI